MLAMPTVLVVDDEPLVRDVLIRYLQREGFDTLEAGDGDTARTLVASGDPQLVVLDLMLPGRQWDRRWLQLGDAEKVRLLPGCVTSF